MRSFLYIYILLGFSTLWYELLSTEFPFKKQPAEAIIWQVGRGLKQSLGHIQASRDVKVRSGESEFEEKYLKLDIMIIQSYEPYGMILYVDMV